jgi:hypothetical protein
MATLKWEPPVSRFGVDSTILANLLLRGMKQMAEEFIKDKDMKELLATHHKVEIFDPRWSSDSEWRLRSCCGTIAVILASTLNSPTCFEWFLERAGRHVDATSMLVNLIRHPNDPNVEVAEIGFSLLLKRGADPNAHGYALTPLQLAAWSQNKEAIEMLLEHGANRQAKGTKGGKAVAFFKEEVQGLCPLDIIKSVSWLWELYSYGGSYKLGECLDLLRHHEMLNRPD